MPQLLLTATLACLLALLLTPVMRRAALRYGVLDLPNGRKLHARPTPLLGGLVIYAAVVGALLVDRDWSVVRQLAGILAGATWISFWGLWDDRNGLRVLWKLLAHVAAAALLILAGVAVHLPVPEPINLLLTILWVVGITNAFNLLDNMDGLAGGLGAIAAGFFLLLAALGGQVLVGSLAAAVLGACLGFLFHNFNPATIFLGDSGSLFLGFLMAGLGIKLRFPDSPPQVSWMVPILVLGIPLLDTTLVVVSRLRRGKNPLTSPGRDHLSHRLLLLGLSQRQAAVTLYCAALLLGCLAVLVSRAQARPAFLIAVLAATAGAAVIFWLERSTQNEVRSQP